MKAMILAICALLGSVGGYFAAPIASNMYIHAKEPDMFGAFLFLLVDNEIVCNCQNRPPNESLRALKKDISILQGWRDQSPNSKMLGQEIGLAEIRLSRIEEASGDEAQAEEALNAARIELAPLGWKDLSAAHLIALTTQLDSEYRPKKQNKEVASLTAK